MKTLAFCRALWYNFLMENREMQTSNTEEMVTISRAEYERLQQQAQSITSLTLQNEWLLEQLSFTYVPVGTGIQPSGLEAVPADDGQLAVEGLREVAAVGL